MRIESNLIYNPPTIPTIYTRTATKGYLSQQPNYAFNAIDASTGDDDDDDADDEA